MIAAGIRASPGFAKIWNVNSMEIKVIAMPASVESKAALGVILLSQSPTKAPAVSITPLKKQATSPTFHARSGFFVS